MRGPEGAVTAAPWTHGLDPAAEGISIALPCRLATIEPDPGAGIMALFGIAWALLCVGVDPPAPASPRGDLAAYPTAGVAFREPRGWTEQLRNAGKTVARWTNPDSEPEKPAALIMIECARPKVDSLEETAQGLARNFRGAVDDQPTSLDGARALRITATNPSKALRPVEALAAIHDGRLYLVMGGAISGRSVKDEIESIRASWTWTRIESPSEHLAFRDEPLPLGRGTASINVPALMHTYPTDEPDRVLELGLHNFARNEPDFLIYAQVVTLEPGLTFDKFKGQLADGLQAQNIINGPLEWRTLSDTPPRLISNMVESGAASPDGPKQAASIRWVLVKLDERRVASVNFTLPAAAAAAGERDVYMNLMERIAESIRPGADVVEPKEKGTQPTGADRIR